MVTDTAVTAFHCATPTLSHLEDQLLHCCHYGRALTLVLGAPGSGRSHLSRRLFNALSDQLPVALIEAHPMISSQQIDQSALQQLGLTQLALQQKSLSSAIAEAPPGRRILIVDDAQDLALHLLRELLELVANEWEREDPRLCVVLIGDEMLETALAEIEFRAIDDNDVQRLSLAAFSLEDMQRLAAVWAASVAEAEPSEELIRSSWQKSSGRPGTFLQLLSHRPEDLTEPYEDDLVSDVVEHHGAHSYSLAVKYAWLKLPLIFFGVFILALILLYQNEFNSWISTEEKTVSGPTQAEQKNLRQEVAINPNDLPAESPPEGSAAIEIIEEATPIIDVDSQGSGEENQSAQKSTTELTPIGPAQVLPAQETPVRESASNEIHTKPSAPISKPGPEVAQKLAPSKPSSTSTASFTSDEQKLLEAPASYHAVQIIGLVDEQAMAAFAAKYQLSRALAYRSARAGKPWHILVLGPYDSRAKAEAARDQLPDAIRKQGPWIKSLKVVQEEIQAGAKLR